MTTIKTIISPIEQIGNIILVCLISLTCLTSCGGGGDDDDMALSQPEAGSVISFSCGMAESQTVTRAGTPLSDANVTTFKVWGYKNMTETSGSYGGTQAVMPSFTVKYLSSSVNTTTSNTSGWEYVNQQTGSDPEQSIKYWDWNAAAYRFFAVTGTPTYNAEENSFTIEADASSKESIDATPYFSKLWFSTGKLPTYADKQFGKPVTLEFLRPFTRVRFLFRYVYPREGTTLETPIFKPTDNSKIARKGTVKVTYPLEGAATEESYTIVSAAAEDPAHLAEFTEDYDPDDDTKTYTVSEKGWYTVFPNISQGTYTLTVTVNKAEKTVVVPAEYMTWLPGYSYTYIFKITEEGGVEIGWVEYAVTGWTDVESDWTVYNW